MRHESRARFVRNLIRDALGSGVRLSVVDGRLQYRATKGDIPQGLKAALQSHKEALVAELSRPVFRKRDGPLALLRYPAYWLDFWNETASNPSLANSTHAAVRLEGEVSLERVQAALQRVGARHDVLRSRAVLMDGVPCLLLEQFRGIAWDVLDVADRRQLTDRVAQAVWTPLTDGAVCRARILRLAPNELVLTFVVHHFVADFISCQLLTSELVTAVLDRGAPTAAGRPLQFSDYLLTMGEWLSGHVLQYRLDYWLEQMGGAPEIRLPRDPAGDSSGSVVVHKHVFQIPDTVRASVARSAADAGVPMAVVTLAAKLAALARTLRTNDVFVTIIASGREHPALTDLIGPMVNCFPVRVGVLPDMSYAELLGRVNETYQLARDYQIPWALFMRALAPTRTECIAPIFNFISGRHGTRGGNTAAPAGVAVAGVDVPWPEETNTVSWKSHDFSVFDSGTDLTVTLKYMPAKCSPGTVAEFGRMFVDCLQALACDPSRTLGH